MASPPYRSPAASPPNPSHSMLPASTARKRPQISMTYPAPPKRRKTSTFSVNSAHPLRQTSFPPEETAFARGERSPSVDSELTGITGGHSVATSAVTGGRKGKGKRRKEDGSVKSGVRGTPTGRSVTGGPEEEEEGDGEGEAEEDGAGDGDGDGLVEEGGRVDRAAEKKKMAVLIDAFNNDQSERYNTYRRVKLKKETVRKITNQTLSQSVPPSVITTISGFTKVFIGTLVERALSIQAQSMRAARTLPTPPPSTGRPLSRENPNNTTSPITAATSVNLEFEPPVLDPPHDSLTASLPPTPTTKATAKYSGPLRPEHLREALRRYKRNGEGGGTGLEGVSVGLGVPGAGAARVGGRRLFR